MKILIALPRPFAIFWLMMSEGPSIHGAGQPGSNIIEGHEPPSPGLEDETGWRWGSAVRGDDPDP
jgi:hypothetical protein